MRWLMHKSKKDLSNSRSCQDFSCDSRKRRSTPNFCWFCEKSPLRWKIYRKMSKFAWGRSWKPSERRFITGTSPFCCTSGGNTDLRRGRTHSPSPISCGTIEAFSKGSPWWEDEDGVDVLPCVCVCVCVWGGICKRGRPRPRFNVYKILLDTNWNVHSLENITNTTFFDYFVSPQLSFVANFSVCLQQYFTVTKKAMTTRIV